MHKEIIFNKLKSFCPNLALGCLSCKVVVEEDRPLLRKEIEETCAFVQTNYDPESIRTNPAIKASRNAYKTLGKDPSRYRLSAEALMRRAVQGKGLYQINNVVDTLNLISLKTGFSIGGYDASKIEGVIDLGVGASEEPYEAIGRGTLNIENLPVLRDEQGAFGTPTSDSVRTMVTSTTNEFLMIFYDFEDQGLSTVLEETKSCLEIHADATEVKHWIIK